MSPSETDTRAKVHVFGFLLLPGFALMSYAAAVEPLRAANVLSGHELYRWLHISLDGRAVNASNGASVVADDRVGANIPLDTALVCAGGNPAVHEDSRISPWLAGLSRRGARIGGVSAGPYVLARAGLLDGYRCTVHWEHATAFLEAFPRTQLRRTLFEIDRNRLTCAGGVAALDMMLALIADDHGRALADRVSDWFVCGGARRGDHAQRLTSFERYGALNPGFLRLIDAIEEEPIQSWCSARFASLAGLSSRHLARLARSNLGMTLPDFVVVTRLERARSLLRHSPMSIAQVAAACGFESASHFARRYRARFGCAPKSERNVVSQTGISRR